TGRTTRPIPWAGQITERGASNAVTSPTGTPAASAQPSSVRKWVCTPDSPSRRSSVAIQTRGCPSSRRRQDRECTPMISPVEKVDGPLGPGDEEATGAGAGRRSGITPAGAPSLEVLAFG